MATPQAKLAQALQALKIQQDAGQVAINSDRLSRDNRERLVKAGFLTPVIKGWYIPSRLEDVGDGETTAWYAAFWEFCAAYLARRFGEAWSLSPEQSVLIHAGNRTVPAQLMIRAPGARNKTTTLIHDTSIVEMRAQIAEGNAREKVDGLQVFKLPQALTNSTEKVFKTYASDMRAALGLIRDSSELLTILLAGGHSTIAGRLAGALRSIGRDDMADEILKAMRAAGYAARETDPFKDNCTITLPAREQSPYINRIHTNWQTMRANIIDAFPEPPGCPNDSETYLKRVDETYVRDAYHSLSIEGYRVNERLIERVRDGEWNPDQIEADKQNRDAMAARGYWLAFRQVKKSVARVLNNENAGDVAEQDHRDWYRELFAASVEAGILGAGDLAGYRNGQVYIRNSRHVPLKKEAILDCMPALFDHLRQEEHAAVRTVLGH